MNKRVMVAIMLFTVFVCGLFVFSNPVLCTQLDEGNFTEGEVFLPADGHYDFGQFALMSSQTRNFTVKYAGFGHVLLVDETGNKVINILNFDNMISHKKNVEKSFIEGELQKTGWIVDGVEVHEIEFSSGGRMYSSCVKDTSTGTMIYIATPSDRQTAEMISSLNFK